MKSRWIEHNGKRVFIADFSNFGLDASALQKECDAVGAELSKELPKSVRSISLVEGTIGSPEIINVFKNFLPISTKYVYKRGAVGLTGLRKAFIDVINKFTGGTKMYSFETLEEALDWITRE